MRGRKLLDALIVLAVAFALPIFWLIEKIIEFRGNGGNDESKNLRHSHLLPVRNHPPKQREPPLFFDIARCPWRAYVKMGKEG